MCPLTDMRAFLAPPDFFSLPPSSSDSSESKSSSSSTHHKRQFKKKLNFLQTNSKKKTNQNLFSIFSRQKKKKNKKKLSNPYRPPLLRIPLRIHLFWPFCHVLSVYRHWRSTYVFPLQQQQHPFSNSQEMTQLFVQRPKHKHSKHKQLKSRFFC